MDHLGVLEVSKESLKGPYGSQETLLGLSWFFWVSKGSLGESKRLFVSLRTLLNLFGLFWVSLDSLGFPWILLSLFRLFWVSLDSLESNRLQRIQRNSNRRVYLSPLSLILVSLDSIRTLSLIGPFWVSLNSLMTLWSLLGLFRVA